MARDTVVSWKTFAIIVLFPPVALVALVLLPVTLVVIFWLYQRGRTQGEFPERASDS